MPFRRFWGLSAVALAILTLPGAQGQLPDQAPGGMKPVAETRLLMNGIAKPNIQGLEKLLAKQPTSDKQWTFARGQALLIAEAGNLLLLRPPKNEGRETWNRRAIELRESATVLGRMIARRDFNRSQTGLLRVAGVCNRCHVNFRVPVQIAPFQKESE